MSELSERLRRFVAGNGNMSDLMVEEAADHIDSLERRLAEAEAREAVLREVICESAPTSWVTNTIGDFGRALERARQWEHRAVDALDHTTPRAKALLAIVEAAQKRFRNIVSLGHASDCAVHNEPATSIGSCDCGAEELLTAIDQYDEARDA